MEAQETTLLLKERVKLFAYHDERLGVPVFVNLVCDADIAKWEALPGRIDLKDVVDVVRKAHERLPHMADVGGAELELEHTQEALSEEHDFTLPAGLRTKRFVFPVEVDRTLGGKYFVDGSLLELKNLLFGHGTGTPFYKQGLLGRAAVEERSGTADLPFYYATLVVTMRYLSEAIHRQLVLDGKIKAALERLRKQLLLSSASLSAKIRHPVLADRVLGNPLAPYALQRIRRILPAGEVTRMYLAHRNEYRLTPGVVQALDDRFDANPEKLGESRVEYDRLRRRVHEVNDLFAAGGRTDRAHEGRVRAAVSWGLGLGAGAAVVTALPWLSAPPLTLDAVLARLAGAAAEPAAVLAAAWGSAVAAGVMLLGWLAAFVRLRRTPRYAEYRTVRRTITRDRALRSAVARSLAWDELSKAAAGIRREYAENTLEELKSIVSKWRKVPGGIRRLLRNAERAADPGDRYWDDVFPSTLWDYLRLKNDQFEYLKLAKLELPDLDFSSLYQEDELQQKWRENACVCFGDGFPSLIIGEANVAAVYFIDVAGSTEISTSKTLSNALELYTRVLPLANESGGEPLWRKEVGDGRYYCYPTQEALRRAVLTAQSCAHPRVGVPVGIGLSVGEIYTDVTTGDFLNEAANRASRLNARDDVVADYIKARYLVRPFRVYVKYGRLYNAGVAVDEKALHALNIAGWDAVELVPPFVMHFPVIAEDAEPGEVSLYAERIEAKVLHHYLDALGNPEELKSLLPLLDRAVVFEVFVRKSAPDLRYETRLNAGSLDETVAGLGIREPAFMSREIERESRATYLPATLPGGQTVHVVVKHEKAKLKGLGPTAVAEVVLPKVMEADDLGRLERFLSSR